MGEAGGPRGRGGRRAGGAGGRAPWRAPPPPPRSPSPPPPERPARARGGGASSGSLRGELEARAEAVRERVRELQDLAEREGLGTPEELRRAGAAVVLLPQSFPEPPGDGAAASAGETAEAARFGGLTLEAALSSAPPRRQRIGPQGGDALAERRQAGEVPSVSAKRPPGRSRSSVEDFGGGLGDIMVAPRRGLGGRGGGAAASTADYEPAPVRSRVGASERHRSTYFGRDATPGAGGESLDQCLGSPLRRRRQHLYANEDDYALPGPDDKIDPRTRAKIKPLIYRPGLGAGEDGQSECSICLEAFQPRQWCQQFKKCRHLFHALCIKEWFETGDSRCPNCRQ